MMEHVKDVRTVRELGGEVWTELEYLIPEARLAWQVKGEVVDIVMGVLARHVGAEIENDPDLPVEPLAPTFRDGADPR